MAVETEVYVLFGLTVFVIAMVFLATIFFSITKKKSFLGFSLKEKNPQEKIIIPPKWYMWCAVIIPMYLSAAFISETYHLGWGLKPSDAIWTVGALYMLYVCFKIIKKQYTKPQD